MSDLPAIRELVGEEIRHCTTPFFEAERSALSEIETLPYSTLGGLGFERLCYELLLSKGYEPRFFGRSGQAQYGVDLVAEKGGRTEVYQCKNLGARPTASDLQGYLDTFEAGWLDQAGLPRPNRFVVCCPTLLRDSEVDAKWILAKESFKRRTNVEAGLWHLDLLNEWLRKLPDVVADLFSDRHAQAFCGVDDWNFDLFTPLRQGASGDRRLRRYFESRLKGRLYVDEGREQKITEALERSPVILVRGLPGTGKTFTALAVAEGLRGAQQRTYFLDVSDDEFTKLRLRDGIRSRLSRPSVFVLENCHEKVEAVSQALEHLVPLLRSGRAAVICLVRRVPGPIESRSDDWEFFAELESLGATVDFETGVELLRLVVEFWRPEFVGLSTKRLARLAALCGGDLFLLDEVLSLIESPKEVDELSPAVMYDMVRRAYFGHKTADDLPVARRLAALAQFGIHPRADVVRPSDEEFALLKGLCVRAGQPPRWHFLHSTAAELLLHALWSGMGVTDPIDVAREAATDVVGYFRDVQHPDLRPPAGASLMGADLLRVMENRPRLLRENGEECFRAAVLDSEAVEELLPRLATTATYARALSLCALVAHSVNARSAESYALQLSEALRELLVRSDPQRLVGAFNHAWSMLHTLEITSPELHAEVSQELDATHILGLIEANCTIFKFFRIIQACPLLAHRLVEALDETRVGRLVAKAIAAGHSMGTFNLALRDLNRGAQTAPIAQELARKVGPRNFLRMIEANGTVFELFMISKDASPVLARELVEALDETGVERLVDKTIAVRRSIGTLDMTLRELNRRAETSDIGQALERKIGAVRFLRLIEANGTVGELFRIIQFGTIVFARLLVEALDEASVERLINKTISAGGSIGTLHLSLRELNIHAETADIGSALERKIGAARFLRLIEANGTVFELFMIIKQASPVLARGLVEALDEERADRLIDKTIAAGRSIGTLNLALRELSRRTETAEIGTALERKIGAARFLRLIEANGSILDLFMIIKNVSPALARGMAEALSEAGAERLINKTVAERRSIGTLNLALWELNRHVDTADIAETLERKIGAARFLRLIEANGTVFELFGIIKDGTPVLARSLVEALDEAGAERLVDKTIAAGRSIGTINLALRDLKRGEGTAQLGQALEQKIGPKNFLRLIEANGTVFELFMISKDSSRALARSLVEALDEAGVERLIDRTVTKRRSISSLNFALRSLSRKQEGANIAQALERKVGAAGFWKLILGAGSPEALVNLLHDFSPGFCEEVLAAACDVSEEQWRRMLEHGDFDQLCLLISDGGAVLMDSTGGPKLAAAIEDQAPPLVAASTWLQRNSGSRRLASCPASPSSLATTRALWSFLTQLDLQTLSFPSLKEAVNGVELLYQVRPDMRASLVTGLRALLPPTQRWVLNPNEDMEVPRALLGLLADPEFSDDEVRYFVDGLTKCLTRQLIAKCATAGILWTLWALFVLARERTDRLEGEAFGQALPPDFLHLLHDSLVTRVVQKGEVDEWRARFALVGLLTLLGSRVDSSVVTQLREELLRHGSAGAWWLCAEQPFVTAFLVLRAVEVSKPMPPRERSDFRRRLLNAAEESSGMDAAAEYLYQGLLRQFDKTG